MRKEEMSRALARVFLDAVDPIILEDTNGVIFEVNRAAERLYGYSRAELVGRQIKLALVPEERQSQADDLLRRCLAREEVRDVEGLRQTKDGTILNILLTLSRLTDDRDRTIGVASFAKDITALKAAEERVRSYARELDRAAARSEEIALLGGSHAVHALRAAIARHAKEDAPLLLMGAPNVGAEAVARAVQAGSTRAGQPFVKVDGRRLGMSGDTTLFGDRTDGTPGKLALAADGVLYIDRIESVPLPVQLRLAQFILKRKTNCRLIAQSVADLHWLASERKVDAALANLLGRRRLALPSLSERPEDVPEIARRLLEERAFATGKAIEDIDDSSVRRLIEHGWSGNLQELRSVIERAVDMCTGPLLEVPRRLLAAGPSIGGYQLTAQVGAGGMGEVWLAEHALLRRPAAVKLIATDLIADPALRAGMLARFEREAQATAQLRSPHSVELYDYGVTPDGTLYYVMEYLEGEDILRLLRTHGPFVPERVAFLLIQITYSLEEAHGRGLVHRDIKPGNVFVARLGTIFDYAKVLDFGIVKLEAGVPTQMTGTSVPMGTPGYMAPEIIMGGAARATAAADIYSFGVLAYWMLTGRAPFEDADPSELMSLHLHAEPRKPSALVPAIPPELDAIVLACLLKDPNERPRSMADLRLSLQQVTFARPWTQALAREWWRRYVPAMDVDAAGIEMGGTFTDD